MRTPTSSKTFFAGLLTAGAFKSAHVTSGIGAPNGGDAEWQLWQLFASTLSTAHGRPDGPEGGDVSEPGPPSVIGGPPLVVLPSGFPPLLLDAPPFDEEPLQATAMPKRKKRRRPRPARIMALRMRASGSTANESRLPRREMRRVGYLFTRSRYWPEEQSILIHSPSLMKSGTFTTAPVD